MGRFVDVDKFLEEGRHLGDPQASTKEGRLERGFVLWRPRKAKKASIIVRGMTVKEFAKRFPHSNKRLKELRSDPSQTVLYSFKRFDRLVRFDSGLGAQGALVERVHQ